MNQKRFLKVRDENGDQIVARGEFQRTEQKRRKLTPDKQFKAFDSNKNGMLDGKELRKTDFATGLGAQPGGSVSKNQFLAIRNEQMLRAQFADYDRDRNGLLQGQEIQAAVNRAKDVDGNQALDIEEWLGIKKLAQAPQVPSEPPRTVEATPPATATAPEPAVIPPATPVSSSPASPGLPEPPVSSTPASPGLPEPPVSSTPVAPEAPVVPIVSPMPGIPGMSPLMPGMSPGLDFGNPGALRVPEETA